MHCFSSNKDAYKQSTREDYVAQASANAKGSLFEVELMLLSEAATYIRFNSIHKEQNKPELDVHLVSSDQLASFKSNTEDLAKTNIAVSYE